MSKKTQRDKAFAKATTWNMRHRVGDTINYTTPAGEVRAGKTTSTATVVGNQAVVWIGGAGAAVPLDRVKEVQLDLAL